MLVYVCIAIPKRVLYSIKIIYNLTVAFYYLSVSEIWPDKRRFVFGGKGGGAYNKGGYCTIIAL